MERLFHIKASGSTISREIVAGLTTFLSMAYILAVNPNILGETGMSVTAVFMATAVASGIACIVMGLVANYPVALAPGMGVNAFFTYTVVITLGYTWRAALAAVMVSGLVFIIISVTGVRKKIINSIPTPIKAAIGAGIGGFVAFVGLKNAAIVVANESTFVGLGDFSQPGVLLACFGILLTVVLYVRKVPAAIFIGMIITTIVGLIAGFCGVEGMPSIPTEYVLTFDTSATFQFIPGFTELFSQGIFKFIVVIFSFLFVDFFDTAGCLLACAGRANLVDEKGNCVRIERALLADAIGTVAGAALGTSTVTSYVESTSGIEAGGRTGLTACTTGVMFFLSLLLSPIFLSVITSEVTTPALVVVGGIMVAQLKDVDWKDVGISIAAFVTFVMMILSYSISNGIALGFIVYTAAELASGKERAKKIHPIVYILDAVFVLYFIFTYCSNIKL